MIEQFLKDNNARLVCGWAWLYWDEDAIAWRVLSHAPYQRGTPTLYNGTDLAAALKALGGEE